MSEGDLGVVEERLLRFPFLIRLAVVLASQDFLPLRQGFERFFGSARHSGFGRGFDDAMDGSQMTDDILRVRC